MSDCPHFRDVQRLLTGPTAEPELDWLERHLNDCEFCCDRLAALPGIGTIVPAELARWQTRSPSSAALKQAIEQLLKETPVGQAAALQTGSEFYLDFLHPTEERGFIGRIGNYQVRRIIGRGGMGIVLEALDPLLKRTVAIKMLAPWTVLDAETKARFLREAQSAAALTHENVVAIYAVEQIEGVLFLVLEYVAGESLDDRLRREGKLSLGEVVRLGAQVARGLAAAHSRGLIHRDIKPGNILLVEETGRAKIADFGLAKATGEQGLTQDGTVLGTPEFMSPEQATNQQPDERSDLFSLGAVLYYASTGCSPFRADTLLLTLDNVRRCQPPPLQNLAPELPPWFCELVNRLLSPAPEDRLGWATAVAETLERPSSQATVVNLPLGPAPVKIHDSEKQKAALRQWWPIAAVLLVIAVVIPAWIVGSRRMRSDTTPPQTARAPESQLPPPRPLSLPPGFAVSGRDEVLGSLAAALDAANDGDIIEVRGNGPFLTPPLSIAGKRLTIRAALGSLPVILSETPSSSGAKPLLATDADLRLEGLEIHWTIEPRIGMTEAEMLARTIVTSTHGRLIVTHCRIVSERLNGCVGGTCQTMIVHRSHLLAKNGMGAFWRVEPGGRLDIEGCVLESHYGIDLLAGTRATGDSPANVRLSHSTLAAIQSVQLIVESAIRQPIRVSFDHDLVDAEYLIVLMARLPPRAKAALKLDDLPTALRSLVAWTEDSNVYRPGLHYLARPVPGQAAVPQPAGIANIERWLELWKLPSAKSIEGKIRFQARPTSVQTAPLVLDEVGDPTGSVPTSVGARPDQVGPGPAYDAWRKSAEYASWPTF